MILNNFERAIMNSPIRAWFQRHFEANRLLSMGGSMSGGIALEVGCGRGIGSEIIFNIFNAEKIDGFDIDPDMVKLAQKRLNSYSDKIKINEGDVTKINSTDNYYDAVFNFGIIHHVPSWREAIGEIFRVLKPGGRFYCEEVLEKAIISPINRRLFDHPQEDRFNHNQFINVMKNYGFTLIGSSHILNRIGYYIADK